MIVYCQVNNFAQIQLVAMMILIMKIIKKYFAPDVLCKRAVEI